MSERLDAVSVERRSVGADASVDGREFNGHAAVFNQRTAIGNPLSWGFYEEIATGAFDKTLREADVVMLSDHDVAKPVARVSAGTLNLNVDSSGLATNVPEIPDTTYGNDLVTNLRNGNVKGMSFGFQVVQDEWTTEQVETVDGQSVDVDVRTITEVRLIEVSTTAFPAYSGTDASVRSAYQSRNIRQGWGKWDLDRVLSLRASLESELRVGATLSADTMETLQQVLDLVAAADVSVDQAQPLLATLMGVPNPDADDSTDDDSDDDDDARSEWTEDDERRRKLDIYALSRRKVLGAG